MELAEITCARARTRSRVSWTTAARRGRFGPYLLKIRVIRTVRR